MRGFRCEFVLYGLRKVPLKLKTSTCRLCLRDCFFSQALRWFILTRAHTHTHILLSVHDLDPRGGWED
jgi:hypothetical protein